MKYESETTFSKVLPLANSIRGGVPLDGEYLMQYLLNVFHHNSFDLRNLGFNLGELVDLLGVVNTVLHVLFKFRSFNIE
jgi:hypothetical protein